MSDKRADAVETLDDQRESARIPRGVAEDLLWYMPVGLYIYELEDPEDDRSLRLIAANPASTAFTGVKGDDIVGQRIDDCFPGLRARGIPQRYAEAVRSGRATELEAFDYRDERVAEKTFSVKAFPVDERRVGVVFEDISQRKRVESMLHLTQFAIDHVANAVFWMKPDARFAYVNNAACESLGYTREELLSMRLYDIDPLITEELWNDCWRTMRLKQSLTRESVHRRKDGREFPVEVSINYLRWGGQEYDFCFVRDITQRKKDEKEIRAANEQLKVERQALEDKNVAMREVLARVEEEKQSTREHIRVNVEEGLAPILARLKEQGTDEQRALLDLLEQHLREITSPFLDVLRTGFSRLTPREQEICLMIKAGRKSRQIARMLNISLLTIHKHREKIRKKLGLTHTDANLNSFLKAL